MSILSRLFSFGDRGSVGEKSTRKNGAQRRATASAEVLEIKQYPAATLMASLTSNGILRIEGTEHADRIIVREQSGSLTIDSIAIQTSRGGLRSIPAAAVTGIEVASLGGNDVIVMSAKNQVVSKPARIDGGWGDDQIVGGSGNDVLYGSFGNDLLVGVAGDDMLFGGQGFDRLAGGTGADRFLYQYGDGILDSSSSDAVISFTDGTRRWSDAEIIAVDDGLGWLQARTGNTRILKLATGQNLTFQRDTVLQGDSRILGDNDDMGRIRIADSLFRQSRQWIGATVVHEIAHNWDEQHENPFIAQFRAQSGWVNVGMEQWRYSPNATFSRAYGRTNPYEDFATMMETAYGLRPEQNVSAKLATINRFLDAMRGNTAFASMAAPAATFSPRLPLASYTMNREIQSVVTVSNTSRLNVGYYVMWPGQGWTSHTLRPGQALIHASKDPGQRNIAPLISFDNSAQPGYQETRRMLASKFYVVSPVEGWGAPGKATDGIVYNFVANASITGVSLQMDNRMDTTRRTSERRNVSGFPSLGSNFEVIGALTSFGPMPGRTLGHYNCIAWTLGITSMWVNPVTSGGFNVLAGMDQLYASRGYTRISGSNFSLESGLQKITVYAKRDALGHIEVTHGALQQADGTWTSKLGGSPLIRHATPQALNGQTYGVPVAVYVRRTSYGWTNASMARGSSSGFAVAAPTTRNITVADSSSVTAKTAVRQKPLGVAPVAGDAERLTFAETRAARLEQRQLRTQLADVRKGELARQTAKAQTPSRQLADLGASLDELALDAVMSDLRDVMMVI